MINFYAEEALYGAMIHANRKNGSLTVSEMTAGGSRLTEDFRGRQICIIIGSTAKIGIANARIATLRHGTMMTA